MITCNECYDYITRLGCQRLVYVRAFHSRENRASARARARVINNTASDASASDAFPRWSSTVPWREMLPRRVYGRPWPIAGYRSVFGSNQRARAVFFAAKALVTSV